MDPIYLSLIVAIFAAAALQAATGVGFGVIAGPVLLAYLNDVSAIQISIVLNLLTAIVLTPSVWQQFDRRVMRGLVFGIALGAPLGFWLFLVLPLVHLKLLAGAMVLLTLTMLLLGERLLRNDGTSQPRPVEALSAGIIGGAMGTSLAIPGPVPAAWMTVRGFDKIVVRATMLVMFLFAYTAALLLQVSVDNIERNTWQLCLQLSIPTMLGIVIGTYLSTRVSTRVFRSILIVVLTGTIVALFSSILA